MESCQVQVTCIQLVNVKREKVPVHSPHDILSPLVILQSCRDIQDQSVLSTLSTNSVCIQHTYWGMQSKRTCN